MLYNVCLPPPKEGQQLLDIFHKSLVHGKNQSLHLQCHVSQGPEKKFLAPYRCYKEEVLLNHRLFELYPISFSFDLPFSKFSLIINTLEMRQKTRCVWFVEKQPAFLTLRLNEEQLQLLRNEMQGQLLEQFLCFGHIAKYFRERHHTAFAKPSMRFRYQNTSSFLKVFLNCKVKSWNLYLHK